MTVAVPTGSSGPSIAQRPPLPALARLLTSPVTLAVLVFVTVAVAVCFGALSSDRGLFDPDEEIYVRVIHLFGKGLSLDLLRTYGGAPASPAPLFFVVYSWFGKALGSTFGTYRTLSLILTLLAVARVAAFAQYARAAPGEEGEDVLFPSMLLLFPYIFSMAFSVMAEPLTLFLTVVALCAYIHGLSRHSNASLVFGAVVVTAALHVRVHALFVPAGLMAVLLLRKDRSVLRWILAIAPVLLRVPLFLLQGGFAVNRDAFLYTKPELGFCPSHINFFFVWLGYCFFPLLWWCRRHRQPLLLFTVLLIPFYVWVAPDFLAPEHKGAIRTAFLHFGIHGTIAKVIAFPAWFAGCYLTLDLIRRLFAEGPVRERFLAGCVVAFMSSLVFSTVAFERYYQLAVPALVLLGVKRSSRGGKYVAVAIGHFVYIGLAGLRLAADLT